MVFFLAAERLFSKLDSVHDMMDQWPDRVHPARSPDKPGQIIGHPQGWPRLIGLALTLTLALDAMAQIDPQKRRVFQAGYSLSLLEHGPFAGYAYYYHNQPSFPATNQTLRLVVVPVYVDAELGLEEVLGPHTALAPGISAGGFADSYNEIRNGDYLESESFVGHTAAASLSLYHLFNPEQRAPIHGILRAGLHSSFFARDDDTAPSFELPGNQANLMLRAGLRLGGREPYLRPELAGELSIWYQGELSSDPGSYGFEGDREVERVTHSFWARGLLAWTMPTSGRYFQVSLNLGTSVDADRFTAYRLGGSLEFTTEFPLRLPGYHAQEISAESYALLDATFLVPLMPSHQLMAGVFGSVGGVDYLDSLRQEGNLHSGVGAALLYRSGSSAWNVGLAYSYGFQAIREDDRGGHTVSFMLQYDLDALSRAGEQPFWDPLVGAKVWRGIFGVFR